ncbi:sulfatase-like hydrolase/transferase [Motilimonas sp. 1_MG-2023]|uniref:sulfatase-like hydrolase/transferase n=1 Tax=Motilimonas sp. 1_MG-2023 TaxID=3062672 RepID=UPI0026E15788|nr:sulfatase-like hydrolase/transferase [Motilimonas sp. 1_MG-2023]MDO6524831.1 sulfatase-like hydrolase/transferase [Motilimonas sp. 1_MG-2023]
MSSLILVMLLKAAAIPAALASCGLLLLSVQDSAYSGPKVKAEITQHFSLYFVAVMLRLSSWSFLIFFWLGMAGALIGFSLLQVSVRELNFTALMASAGLMILLGCGFQFCYRLLIKPGAILITSSYSMARLIPLWRRLSISRLRWVALLFVGSCCWLLWQTSLLLADVALSYILLCCLLALPVLIAYWPALCFPARCWPVAAGQQAKMNVITLGCDTLRADCLGIDGCERQLSPAIDTLAKHSCYYSRCYTPIPRTAPSLASWFTGTYPDKHGVKTNFVSDETAKLKVSDLASELGRAGYQTAVFTDWTGSDFKKMAMGFDKIQAPDDQWNLKYLLRQGPKHFRMLLALFSQNRLFKRCLPELYYLPGVPLNQAVTQDVCHWLACERKPDQPFFLNMFIGATHPPFSCEYPYYSAYGSAEYLGNSKFGMCKLNEPEDIIRSQKEPESAFDLSQILHLYDGCVRCFDDQVRRIKQQLDQLGLTENTLLVIYSDHGIDFFERNCWGQGNDIFGTASARVPLLIFDPRQPQPEYNQQLCSSVDLMPSLLSLLDLPIPTSVQGRVLQQHIEQSCVYYETGLWLAPPPAMPEQHLRYPELTELLEIPDKQTGTLAIKLQYQLAVEQARDKMLLHQDWALARLAMNSGYQYQLYNFVSDPSFTTNLASQHPELVNKLQSML